MINKFGMKKNQYLRGNVKGFFSLHYYPGRRGFLNMLKNDKHRQTDRKPRKAINDLKRVLQTDFRQILEHVTPDNLTVCVVPRAKKAYKAQQPLFKETVGATARLMLGFQDGSDFITRCTNTNTTQLKKPIGGFKNDGPKPYPDVAHKTCHFASMIKGRDILLVDDIYAEDVNIAEDMAQALFDKGARSVVFYAIGYTSTAKKTPGRCFGLDYTGNAISVMAAATCKGIGKAWIVKNLSAPTPDCDIAGLLNASAKGGREITIDDFNKKKSMLRQKLLEVEKFMDGVVAIGDDNFPSHRGSVRDSEKPVFLFYRGDLSLLSANSNNVAVIGLLRPSQEIAVTEREIVADLVKGGAVIVSGLALGCDSIAHKQALDSNGKTVAILPSPLSNITPAANRGLAEEIVDQGGLLITEYLTAPKSKMDLNRRYDKRDRLQALFSNSILLSASYAKNDVGNDSGSRLAMGYAKKYSIPRAVIYDEDKNLGDPMFDLNRQVIREGVDVVVNGKNRASALPEILQLKPGMVYQKPAQQGMI